MKKFNSPKMVVLHLKSEDIIRTSTLCQGHTCKYYTCPDCIECVSGFECLSLKCDWYYY